jgi:hypothetical protein
MPPNTLRIIPALAALVFGVLLLTPHFGHGENAASALAAYEPFMPGSPIPKNVECEGMSGFYDSVQILCRMEGGPHCEQGYVVGRDGVIIHTTFFRCHFPVAFLIAEYGRYEEVRRYRRVLVLRWPGAYAHVRREGWMNSMEPVSIVTWWKPPEPAD